MLWHLKVDLTYDIENNMPTFIQRAVHEKRIIIKPTEGATSGIQKASGVVKLFVVYCSLTLYALPVTPILTTTAANSLLYLPSSKDQFT